MHKEEKILGNDFESISIYHDIYKSFPSYRHLVGKPYYNELMDNKILQCVLGVMDQRDLYTKTSK